MLRTKPRDTRELIEGSKSHGTTRFHEDYNVRELIVEYRLLRRIIIEQVSEALHQGLDKRSAIALNMAVDTVLQGGVEHLPIINSSRSKPRQKFSPNTFRFFRTMFETISTMHCFICSSWPPGSPGLQNMQTPQRASNQPSGPSCKQPREWTSYYRQSNYGTSLVSFPAHTVDLRLLLSEIAQQCSHQAQSKGLKLEVDVPGEAQVTSDEGLLTLVLQNLLGNAVKYSSRGTVKITANNGLDGNATGWVLSISDQGPGIPADSLTNLFDAFKRGDTYGKPGVGLGLTIATHATRLLGGELKIESELNVGSTFHLVLPSPKAPACERRFLNPVRLAIVLIIKLPEYSALGCIPLWNVLLKRH